MVLEDSNIFGESGFLRSVSGVEHRDLQYLLLPMASRYDGKKAPTGHGFQAHTGPMRSPSRGRVQLNGADPRQAPSILFNYMSTEKDWQDFRRAIRLTREIFATDPIAGFVDYELQPGADAQSNDELDAVIREHAESAYHPCGTCRMGAASDPDAVVDPDNRVIGVDGL